MRVRRAVLLACMLLVAASCETNQSSPATMRPPAAPSGYMAIRVADGLSQPLDLTAPPGDTARIFVAEKTGAIRILKRGQILPRPFLDISGLVSNGGEQGLLGLAFHPQYVSNGKFYVDYTDRAGDTRVVEYLVSSNPDSASAVSREILFVKQPYANHNGGQVAFGPDGYLYIGLGDGGSGGDPQGNGQNLNALLGKILRIDVNSGSPYSIPAGNPFVGQTGKRGEIWSYGLRNPWRFCFDRANGDMIIADVGQTAWEEVDYEPAGMGGRNYGWNRMEGKHCYPPGTTCNQTGLVLPVTEYDHQAGCSVTGGYVYRGSLHPELAGTYFYGDYCTGLLRSFRILNGSAIEEKDWTRALRTEAGGAMQGLSSFGLDASGELYMVLLDGEIYKLVKRP
ncbi:MAG TPA: PQQ-dependent sugar dehydrogenase [Candidatus Eisenbacteria bacterium]|nr:PQQ-dependent sugar dehydrogenase [Candidatus Eisenbacteria bacterium]